VVTSYDGGAGGGPGAAGAVGQNGPTRAGGTGGAAGAYVLTNANITWQVAGTRLGTVA
jgi:hypothetical protein